ncbi:MAG: hypothetical protein ABIG64_00700 [Candidatus Omnitrophota bacterium]
MQQKHFLKITFIIVTTCFMYCVAISCSFAQTSAKLKVFKLQGVKSGLNISIENSKSPLDVHITKSEYPSQLRIELLGTEITFQEYKNIPIEIPINKYGVSKIIVEQKKNFLRKPANDVFITAEMNQDFTYLTDSQWEGQYLDIVITPGVETAEKQKFTKPESKLQPSKKMEIIRQQKAQDAQEARKKLEEFSQKKTD